MQILVPTAATRSTVETRTAVLASLHDKRVAIVSNGWRSMDAMVPRLSERLMARGVNNVRLFSVHINKAITAETLEQIGAGCDAAIVGLAN